MKQDEFLQDAIGLIDDDLLTRDDRAPNRRPGWIRWTAAAACLALILGIVLHTLPKRAEIRIAQNLWQQEDFQAFSLSYREAAPQKTASDAGEGIRVVLLSETTQEETQEPTQEPMEEPTQEPTEEPTQEPTEEPTEEPTQEPTEEPTQEATAPQVVLEAHPISISQDQTFRFEQLITHRYAVYRSETGDVMFYDTVEDRRVDLQERILGDTSYILEALKEMARAVAEEKCPSFMASPVNRAFLDSYIAYQSNGDYDWGAVNALPLDTGFVSGLGYFTDSEEEKRNICKELVWDVYVESLGWLDDAGLNAPYEVWVRGVDETNGICIIGTASIGDIFCGDYMVYDIRTDTCSPLVKGDTCPDLLQWDGYILRFSQDGTVATAASPAANLSGGNLDLENVTDRFETDTVDRKVSGYRGEDLGVFFLEDGTFAEFQNPLYFQDPAPGASELFVSGSNSVLYYKKMDEALAGKTFYASDAVWYNRLKLYNRDTDIWAFRTVNEAHELGQTVELQGNFLRFAANETVAVMERGGSCFAYSLADGRDVTQDIREGRVAMYAHEQLRVLCEEGQLYAENMFTGQRKRLGPADKYILSSDGAFAFAYCGGDSYVTCYNAASGESCRIAVDSEMRTQLFEREDAVLQMSYNAQENTLLLSYYAEEDVPAEYDSNVDFYGLLAQLKDEDPDSRYPDYPRVITDLKVSEEVMQQFREGAYRYDHPDGVIYWYTYYPEFLTPYETKSTVFECLGLTEPEEYLDVNGTQFVLYEEGDEKLLLTFWQYWLLFDYQDTSAGFTIEYIKDGKVYDFQFWNGEWRNQYLGGDASLACSAETQTKIDTLVVELVKKQHDKARQLLLDNREKLEELSRYLYEKETITGDEFMKILNEK